MACLIFVFNNEKQESARRKQTENVWSTLVEFVDCLYLAPTEVLGV
jgi:hypothetical protein